MSLLKPKQRPYLALSIGFLCMVLLLALVPGFVFAQAAPSPTSPGSTTTAPVRSPDSFYELQQAYQFILNNYVDEVDSKVLMEGAFKGMMDSLKDPYTVYLGREDWRSLNDTTTGEFGGIGAYIEKQRDIEGKLKTDGFIEIAAPIEDTPAFFGGAQAGDLIVSIDGKDTSPMTVDEAVSNLRGKPGSEVKLKIQRGLGKPFDMALVRQIIRVPTHKQAMIDDIGYIRIIQFTPRTIDAFVEAYNSFKQKKAKGLIIDLRNNPGGVLDSPLDIADQFFDDGVLLTTKARQVRDNETFDATPGTIIPQDLPVVILTNSGSASASEILSGIMKDRKRAVLVGEKTFGKGSVQRVIPMGANDHGFKMTTARYYTPSGVTIDKVGIMPNILIAEPEFTAKEEEDFVKLRTENLIGVYLAANPANTSTQFETFLRQLASKGINLQRRYIERLVKVEKERRDKITSIYDLEYDIQLQKGLEVIRTWIKEKRMPEYPAILPVPQQKK